MRPRLKIAKWLMMGALGLAMSQARSTVRRARKRLSRAPNLGAASSPATALLGDPPLATK